MTGLERSRTVEGTPVIGYQKAEGGFGRNVQNGTTGNTLDASAKSA